jgi:His/Glu/Gln/Arg/opine family amino acid ABC transporter permease subunit
MNISNVYLLLKGTLVTLELWVVCSLISIIFGFLIGILRCSKLRVPIISSALDAITMVLRGVPLYTQLMIFYFVLPEVLGLNLSSFISGCIALGLCSGAYASEAIRGSINTLPQTQWDASSALGYSVPSQLIHIILPQAIRNALPALVSEYSMVLKSTSMIASIGVLELTKVGTNIISRSLDPLPVCLGIGAIYLIINSILYFIGQAIERRYHVAN